jgi:hypothetical protein
LNGGALVFDIQNLVDQYAGDDLETAHSSNLFLRLADDYSSSTGFKIYPSGGTTSTNVALGATGQDKNQLLFTLPTYDVTSVPTAAFKFALGGQTTKCTFATTGTTGVLTATTPNRGVIVHMPSNWVFMFVVLLLILFLVILVIAGVVYGYKYYKKRKGLY